MWVWPQVLLGPLHLPAPSDWETEFLYTSSAWEVLPFYRFQRQRCIKILCPKDPDSLFTAGTENGKGSSSQHWRCIKISLPRTPPPGPRQPGLHRKKSVRGVGEEGLGGGGGWGLREGLSNCNGEEEEPSKGQLGQTHIWGLSTSQTALLDDFPLCPQCPVKTANFYLAPSSGLGKCKWMGASTDLTGFSPDFAFSAVSGHSESETDMISRDFDRISTGS